MAKLKFTAADVARLAGLPNTQAVENLVTSRAIEITAYTVRGRPLFDVDAVRRAAEHVVREEAPPA
jgi:hypothetical protein